MAVEIVCRCQRHQGRAAANLHAGQCGSILLYKDERRADRRLRVYRVVAHLLWPDLAYISAH